MAECIRCGISEEKELLFSAISSKGVVKICKKCNEVEEFPLIGKEYTDRPEKTKTVYERLSSMAHLDPEKHKSRMKETEELSKTQRQNKTLKDIVDENFARKISTTSKPRTDLVENFHWLIMRSRRAKKLTQGQLAEGINESEVAIRMAEAGHVADSSDTLVRKLENYFSIKLFREDSNSLNPSSFAKTEISGGKDLSIEDEATKNLTIAELQ